MPPRDATTHTPPADPAEWRPQKLGRGNRALVESIVEPYWGGVRVLAHVAGGETRFVDEDGDDCTAEFADVATAFASAVLAGELIVDGHLTVRATQADDSTPDSGLEAPGVGAMMTQMIVGSRGVRRAPTKHRLDPEAPIAFVAVDLLRIDGTSLLDVPLLERKRLLESSLRNTDVVRVTPFVRHPIGSFVATWRGMGFDGLVYKTVNSRYMPGVENDEWAAYPMPTR